MAKGGSIVERENPVRAVYLTSVIDAAAFDRLAQKIIQLRLKSDQPICLFIQSIGGSPHIAEKILRLIRAPRPDGQKCMVTTVCIGLAASAAADMLSAGDYAISYNDSVILVHGTRERHEEITIENVRDVADSLDESNDYFAMKLANRMFRRFATQALLLEAYKSKPPASSVVAVAAEPMQILGRIRDSVQLEHKGLIDSAMDRMRRLTELVKYSSSLLESKPHSDPIANDCQLLKHLVDYEVSILQDKKAKGDASVRFSTETIEVVREDFEELKEFLDGSYLKQASELSRSKGHYFLTAEEMLQLKGLKTEDEKSAFLESKATPKIMPLWYLVVSLCRALQIGEHVFSAHDAWWFGLIDEVPGSNLPSLRLWKEQRVRTVRPQAITDNSKSAIPA